MIPSEFNQDIMAQQRKLSEARDRSEKFKVGDRVKLTGKSGETQKKNGFATTGKIKDAQISSGRRFFRVGWDDGKNSSLFDLQSRLGLDIIKEEVIVEAVSIVAVDNRTGEVILRIPEGQPSKPATELALLASRTKGSVFKLLEPKRLNPRGQLFSFKSTQFRNPPDLATFLRREARKLFNA